MKKRFLFIFVLSTNILFCQRNFESKVVDSIFKTIPNLKTNKEIINAYTDLSQEYKSLNPEKGIIYGEKALQYANKLNWNEGKANALLNIGKNYYSQGEYKIAFKKFEEALTFSEEKITVGRIYRNIALTYISLGDHRNASKFAFQALEISENLKNEAETAENFNLIGLANLFTNQEKKAFYYFNKSLKINEKLNLKSEICKNLQNIASQYYDISDNKNAILYFKKSLELAIRIDYKESMAVNYFSLGKLFIDMENIDDAILNLAKAKKYSLEIKNNRIYNNVLITEAEIYTQKALIVSKSEKVKLLDQAENNLLLSIENAKKTNGLINLSRSYKLLSNVYSLKNEYKVANQYSVLYAAIKDSIYNPENKETIKNLEDKREIEIRDKELKINKLSLEAKEKQKFYFIGALLLFGIIGSLLFYQSKNRKKNNVKLSLLNVELENANKTKMRFFAILNHDLRSPVVGLIHFLHLKKESPEIVDDETKERLENQTFKSAENLLVQMEDLLLWSKGQMDHFQPEKKSVPVETIFKDIEDNFSFEEGVKISFEFPENLSIFTDKEYLKTITRNLTNNAIKILENVENPTIVWKAIDHKNAVELIITDNGIGAAPEKFRALFDENVSIGIKSGLGMHLIRDLSKAIDAQISVDSNENVGTSISISIEKPS